MNFHEYPPKTIRMNKTIFFLLMSFSSFANASTAFKSELSHFSGGLVMTLLAAYAIVRFMKAHRNKAILWSFWFSTIFVAISQTRDHLANGRVYAEVMDFFWHTVGTILAVYILNKIMKPTDNDDGATTTKNHPF